MEFFQFCLEIINREACKFKVAFDTSGLEKLTITSANNVNYEIVHKRNHFLYRCGTIKLHFANLCFKTFLLDQKIIERLLSKWNNLDDLTFCSLSSGPAIDYLSLLHSFHESGMNPPSFKNIKIVSKYGAWKNTMNIMHHIVSEGYLKNLPSITTGKIKVVQGEPFQNFTERVKNTIGSSDVIVMMQTLIFQKGTYDKKKKSKSIKAFLDALKPGAVLFCIDSKENVNEITLLLNSLPGSFLLKPMTINNAHIDFACPNVIYEHVGCLPILTTNGTFFVWEKSSESLKWKLNAKDNSASSCINDLNSSVASTSSQITYDCFKRENKAVHSIPSSPDLATAYTQTEQNEILQETESEKVIELTKRIENLTVQLTDVLENSNFTCCAKDQCFEKTIDACSHLLPNDSNCDDSNSSMISCSRLSGGVQNYEAGCNQNNSITECCCSINHTKVKATSHGFEASNFSNPSVHPISAFSVQSNLSSAQLVIPLANLSADVVSQIISLISQPKQT